MRDGRHRIRVFGQERELVRDGDGVHAGPEKGLVSDAPDAFSPDVDDGVELSQALDVFLGGLEHGRFLPLRIKAQNGLCAY